LKTLERSTAISDGWYTAADNSSYVVFVMREKHCTINDKPGNISLSGLKNRLINQTNKFKLSLE
jgi:hypothetical protein